MRDRFAAFRGENAKSIFWDRFARYTTEAGFVPWITSLLDNHYHTLGYCPRGESLKKMMQRLHGSTAKLVNDLLPHRIAPFWSDSQGRDYFDGCIRDEKQCRKAYRYTMLQSQRHRIVTDWRQYPHTRLAIELDRGVKRSLQIGAFLSGIGYKRYGTRGENS